MPATRFGRGGARSARVSAQSAGPKLDRTGIGNHARDDPMQPCAKAPNEMVQRIEEKQSQLDRFCLGVLRRPLLEDTRPAAKPPPSTPSAASGSAEPLNHSGRRGYGRAN